MWNRFSGARSLLRRLQGFKAPSSIPPAAQEGLEQKTASKVSMLSTSAGSSLRSWWGRAHGEHHNGADVAEALRRSAKVILTVNVAGFMLTAVTATHKVTDLFGTGAFIVSVWAGHVAACRRQGINSMRWSRSLLLTCLVTLWGVRLAGYLFYRVLQVGHDSRLDCFFAEDKEPWLIGKSMFPLKLITFWTLQSLWSWTVLLPVTVAQVKALSFKNAPLKIGGGIGIACFFIGWFWETIADFQKYAFKSIPANKDKWIDTGLFKYCRHPNYFGEIVVWMSIFVIATTPATWRAARWTVVSPLFIYFLLTNVSGIPILEASHEHRYGGDSGYRAYKASTNLLLPWFPNE